MNENNPRAAQTRLAVIDPSVDFPQQLIAGVAEGTAVLVLDPQQDSIQQITQALKQQPSVTSLHLICHGSPGCLYLGNQNLSLASLDHHATSLQQWGKTVASVVLYGCQVAKGHIGKQFLNRWHQLTRTALAASDKRVGSAARGGNWQLDYRLGKIVEDLVFSSTVQQAYGGIFAPTVRLEIPTTILIESQGTLLTFRFRLSEPPPAGGITVTLKGNVPQSLNQIDVFDVRVSGGDFPVPDFDNTGFDFTIREQVATVTSPIFSDGVREGAFQVTYSLLPGPGYTVDSSASSATVTFADTPADVPTTPPPDPETPPTDPGTPPTDPGADRQIVQLSSTPELLIEPEQTLATLTLTLAQEPPDEGLTVFISSNVANALADFNLDAVTVTGGESLAINEDLSGFALTLRQQTATINLPILDDGPGEGLESLSFTLQPGEGYLPDPTASEATFSIVESTTLALASDPQTNILRFEGSPLQTSNAEFSLLGGSLARAIEVGLFEVDDDEGGLDTDGDGVVDVKPGDENYQTEALNRGRVLFAKLPDNPFPNPSKILSDFEGDQRIAVYAVLNNTTDGILRGTTFNSQKVPESQVIFSSPSANEGKTQVKINPGPTPDRLALNFELSDENGENGDDLQLGVQLTDRQSPRQLSLDDNITGEVLDLREADLNNDGIVDPEIVVSFTVSGESASDNFVGFYPVDDETGTVGGIQPGEKGYAEAAMTRRIFGLQGSGSATVTLSGDERKLLAPFLIANGTVDDFLRHNINNNPILEPIAYFNYLEANPDQVDHVMGVDSNTIGFEDLFNAGDRDFNDTIVDISF